MTSKYYALKGIPYQQLIIYENKLNHWLHINLANQSIDFQSLNNIANELWEMNISINALNTLNIFNQNIFDILLKENFEPINPEDKIWIEKSRIPHQTSFFKIISNTDLITGKRRNFIVFIYTGNSPAEKLIFHWIKKEEELVDIFH